MSEKLISLIIPVYNTSKYLKVCIESLLNQTFKDFEMILVDDGSTDNSVEIIKEYQKQDSRIRLIKENHNGVGNARNVGLVHAQGKYVQFLDSDDFFENNMLEEMYNTSEKNETDIVYCSAKKVDINGNDLNINSSYWPINKNIVIKDRVFSYKDCPDIINMFAPEPWMALYRKDFLNKYELCFPNISSSNGACLGFISRVLAKKIYIMDKPFINYRFNRDDSISSKKDVMNMLRQRFTFKDMLIKYNCYNELEECLKKNITNTIKHIISLYESEDNYNIFRNNFKILFPNEYETYRAFIEQQENKYKKLKTFINEEKVILWGASNFLKQNIQKKIVNNNNIIGIIDKDPNKQGEKFGNYEIFSPEILNKADVKNIILTISNNNEIIYEDLKKYLSENHPNIRLLPNIFVNEACDLSIK